MLARFYRRNDALPAVARLWRRTFVANGAQRLPVASDCGVAIAATRIARAIHLNFHAILRHHVVWDRLAFDSRHDGPRCRLVTICPVRSPSSA